MRRSDEQLLFDLINMYLWRKTWRFSDNIPTDNVDLSKFWCTKVIWILQTSLSVVVCPPGFFFYSLWTKPDPHGATKYTGSSPVLSSPVCSCLFQSDPQLNIRLINADLTSSSSSSPCSQSYRLSMTIPLSLRYTNPPAVCVRLVWTFQGAQAGLCSVFLSLRAEGTFMFWVLYCFMSSEHFPHDQRRW